MATDESLIAGVAAGDEHALEELCRRYERPLHRFLARYTGGRDADDLYQETWLRVVRAATRFDTSRRFSTWLFQIAVNLCHDWHRRRPAEPVEPARVESQLDGADGDPTNAIDAAIDARRLLAALPEAQRSVVILRYYHGLTEADVAEILGCPRGTVKSRMHHAMARLEKLAGVRERAES
jgi:RNA polymerase sigma-70 factor (ECF subfamily)